MRLGFLPQCEQFRLLHVGQHQVLFVRHAQFAKAVALGQVGHEVDLLGRRVAWRHARFLQGQHHGHVARALVRLDVARQPIYIGLVVRMFGLVIERRQRGVRGRIEEVRHALHFLGRQGFRAVLQVDPFRFHLAREFFHADGFQQDLDARLVFVVAAAVQVVHAHDGLDVGEQMLPRQELAHDAAQDRRAAHAAARHHLEAHFASGVAHGRQADVVHGNGGAVFLGAIDGDLEFAGQGDEFGVEGAPLAQYFRIRARIDDFIGRDAGERVRCCITDTVAGRLDRVHFHGCQVRQDIGRLLQFNPVELDVLARGEVAIAPVVLARDVREHAHLFRRQQAVGHGDAQHVGVALHVQAVLQAQRNEFLFRQFIGDTARNLVSVLGDAFFDDEVVVLIVMVHINS